MKPTRMMVRCVGLALLSAALVSAAEPPPAESAAEPGKEAKVRQLMELTGSGSIGVQMVTQMLPAMKKMAPNAPETFWQEMMAELKPESFVDLVVPIYMKHFDEVDLDEMIAFYSTRVGRKSIERLPAIMAESMAAGQVWGEQVARKILERLKQAGYQDKT